MADEKLLTTKQAADHLSVNEKTLRAWADKGLIRHVKLPSGYRRFRASDLDAFLRQREHGGQAPAQ